MREYIPILMFVLAAISFAVITIAASTIIMPRRGGAQKHAPYECGVDPIGSARGRFQVKFYLIAVLFILFDIEVIFLYPWAVAFKQLGLFGLIEMALFVVILFVGYLYLLSKRALDWN